MRPGGAGNSSQFSVLLPQDLINKASVTTLHVPFGFGWVPIMDSLLSATWICAGSAKETTWIGALCCILPEASSCLGFPDNSLWAFQKGSVQSGKGRLPFFLRSNDTVGDPAVHGTEYSHEDLWKESSMLLLTLGSGNGLPQKL